MIRYYLSLLLLLTAAGVTAQNNTRTITGTITAAEGTAPLEGVAVTIKGTSTVSGSQPDGIYYIPVTTKDSVLVFSHPSYQTVEVKLTGTNEYNISLHKKPEEVYGMKSSSDKVDLASRAERARRAHSSIDSNAATATGMMIYNIYVSISH